MFEVLVYVYENYWHGDACPELPQLGRKLTVAGFEAEEIEAALVWLDGLTVAAQSTQIYLPAGRVDGTVLPSNLQSADELPTQSQSSLRVYSTTEQEHLGAEALGFVSFLETSGVLPPQMREIVIDRAMAAPADLTLDDLKIIVLMVYWSFGKEPDALVLDELCGNSDQRLAH